jgi:folylpolyglutamate synthase
MQKTFAEKWKELDHSSSTTINVIPSVEDALEYVRNLGGGDSGEGKDGKKVHAFITGSVHLVGRALGALEGVDAL